MTERAIEFITPLTLETLSQNQVAVSIFDHENRYDMEHIALADQADILIIAPATANIIGKAAHGIADDLVSTTVLTMMSSVPVLIVPAMNSRMWENPIVKQNVTALEKAGVKPGKQFNLENLKAVLSTGSPLSSDSFEFVYRDIKEDLCLSSISGGTDLNGCFALGNPIGPVYSEELQCRGLGMKVESFDEMGHSLLDQKGELVCTRPFPSMPLYFWNDPDGERYHNAYFTVYPNIWHHGDYIEIKSDTGGVIIYGRSDATLNPGGVRIGTAEIYRQVETIDEILDSLVVGQNWDNDVRVILFVKLREGVSLTEDFTKRIKKTVRENTTPRHVPAKVIAVDDIPYTISGKKVELAVKKIIHGEPVVNRDALANPESLDLYKDLKELQA